MTVLGRLLLEDPSFTANFTLTKIDDKHIGAITCTSTHYNVDAKLVYITLTSREENAKLLQDFQVDNLYLTTKDELPSIVEYQTPREDIRSKPSSSSRHSF